MRKLACRDLALDISRFAIATNRGVKWTAKTGFLPFGFRLLTLEAMLKPIN